MCIRYNSGVSKKKPGLKAYLPAIAMLIVVAVLLLMPSSDLPMSPFFELIYFDKLVHAGLFATLTFLWGLPGTRYLHKPQKHLILISIFCAVYGIITEYAQLHLTANRTFETIDMIADAAGVIAGCFALMFYKKRILTKTSRH